MGFNTSLMICNDGLDQIQKYPDDFVEGITNNLNDGGSFGVGNHGNCVRVERSEHADITQLIAVGMNYSTKLLSGSTPPHHEFPGQAKLLWELSNKLGYELSLLQRWANELGYKLVPK